MTEEIVSPAAALLLTVQAAATLYMVGLIWFVQRVHYPLFAGVGPGRFPAYQRAHLARTNPVVGPPMLLEAATALALVALPLPGLPAWLPWTGLALLAVIWLSTGLLQIPRHRELRAHFDAAAHRRLVTTNWIRTGAWSLRGLLVLAMLLFAGDAMAIEKLAYRTLEQDGAFELRRTEPHVVAETFVDGDFDEVGNEGFRRLVDYIGGENRSRAEISMTAPVVQEPASEKISMTAPVGQEAVDGRYRITFLMPAAYTLETLPEPNDERIRLRAEPARTVAAIRYSGFWSRSRYEEHERNLRAWMEQRGLEAAGEPVWARYDPPFMPWFLRRNEILIPVREPAG